MKYLKKSYNVGRFQKGHTLNNGKSNPFYGKKHTTEAKEKNRQKQLGKKYPNKKMPSCSEKTKRLLRIIMKGKNLGQKRPDLVKRNWRGGISFESYTTDWTETLRISIRERDKYICRVCGAKQGDIAHDVHHIDYNKKNCNPDNLVTLCRSCHSKTNFNRKNWINYF